MEIVYGLVLLDVFLDIIEGASRHAQLSLDVFRYPPKMNLLFHFETYL